MKKAREERSRSTWYKDEGKKDIGSTAMFWARFTPYTLQIVNAPISVNYVVWFVDLLPSVVSNRLNVLFTPIFNLLAEHWDYWKMPIIGIRHSKKPNSREIFNRIRELSSVMFVFCQVSNAFNLWETYKGSMADDVKRNLERQYQKGIQVDMDIVFRRN